MFELSDKDLVIDIGSNDGTLLSNFKNGGQRVLGIEPTDVGDIANQRGIPTIKRYFGPDTARQVRREHEPASVVTAANCFAHMEDVHAIVDGIIELLKPDGVFISESHYLVPLLDTLQYDTIYHEHLRYYSLTSLKYLLEMHDLEVFHAKPIPSHGAEEQSTRKADSIGDDRDEGRCRKQDGQLVERIEAERAGHSRCRMSRLDTGALRPEFASFRIDELMRQIELEFAPLAATKGLDLTFVACSLVVRSDRRLLRRLLQNLVSNAIKYTPAGRVLVGCRRQDGVVRIDVYDTGVGIPQTKWRDIFVEFHRLDQGAKIARGLGLGLSIVERVARVLGSRIELESESGRGSHFAITVPRSTDAPMELATRESARVDSGQLAGIAALCIDNEPAVLDGMETLLRGWGCEVIKAPSLALALDAVSGAPNIPNGLLVDYHLDQGNGIETIITLRRRLGDLPAILITADRSPDVREMARREGVPVLHKPLKPAALRALLAQWRVLRVAAAE